MLGSEVIKQIQNLIDEYGDLPIEISLNGSDQEVDKINTDSKELRVDVGIDGNLANYDLISLEKLANHLIKIEKDNKHGMVK